VSEAPAGSGLRLWPNIGAEEGPLRPDPKAALRVAAVAALWRRLFAAETNWLGGAGPAASAAGAEPRAIYDWLEGDGALTAWLNTDDARERAVADGRRLSGAPPDAVRRVHDKAFALEAARSEDLLPAELAATIAVLEPETLRAGNAGVAVIQRALDGWPDWARARFTLKPRFGSSGRGRVAGIDGRADDPVLRRALPRLADRGGALLEPWLDRCEDLSASLWLGEGGELRLVGTSAQRLAPSGLYRGQRGTVDSKGRVTSGSDHDEALREAAVAVAGRAARAGYFGPCGLDAFSYRAPTGAIAFRPVVEWNARFTLGIVVLGLLRRARAEIRRAFRPPPERRLWFEFALEAPPGGWPESDASLRVWRFADAGAELVPGLAVAVDRETLDARLGTGDQSPSS
jgi:hypothetical protein